jgi:hypothetical protein
MILVIFSHVNIRFEKKGFKDQTMVYVRKSCLSPSNKAGEIPFVPLSLSVLRRVQTSPLAPGSNVPVNVYTLSTPFSVLFWVSVRTKRNQVLAVVWSLFCSTSMDVEAVLHLRNFFVLRAEISSLIWG